MTADLSMYIGLIELGNRLKNGKAKRVGLLATQAIRSAVNRNVIDKVTKNGSIFLAWSDRPWILDGAAVRVSMVGFDDGTEKDKYLDGKLVSHINADLSTNVDLTTAKPLYENKSSSFQGSMIGGSFQIPKPMAEQLVRCCQIQTASQTLMFCARMLPELMCYEKYPMSGS